MRGKLTEYLEVCIERRNGGLVGLAQAASRGLALFDWVAFLFSGFRETDLALLECRRLLESSLGTLR